MKIITHKFLSDHVVVAFQAESQSEVYQMAALKNELEAHGADVFDWGSHGDSGWSLRVKVKPVTAP